jgi:hypothetical protein
MAAPSLAGLVAFIHLQVSQIRGRQPYSIVRNILYVIRVTPKIKRELRRRSAVEPVIGHLKDDHRMGRNYLWHRSGDATNAILAAVGYNLYGVLSVKSS